MYFAFSFAFMFCKDMKQILFVIFMSIFPSDVSNPLMSKGSKFTTLRYTLIR